MLSSIEVIITILGGWPVLLVAGLVGGRLGGWPVGWVVGGGRVVSKPKKYQVHIACFEYLQVYIAYFEYLQVHKPSYVYL